jgi:Ricin-type beta-trefoil lectin domain-like
MASNGTAGIDGQCLDITGGGTANGALTEEWTCNGGASQQWLAVHGELVNPASGKCLDDPGSTPPKAPSRTSGRATADRTSSGPSPKRRAERRRTSRAQPA